jgi:hypothetical protein
MGTASYPQRYLLSHQRTVYYNQCSREYPYHYDKQEKRQFTLINRREISYLSADENSEENIRDEMFSEFFRYFG